MEFKKILITKISLVIRGRLLEQLSILFYVSLLCGYVCYLQIGYKYRPECAEQAEKQCVFFHCAKKLL